MDDRGADKAEPTGAADRLPEAIEVVELGDGTDKAQRHDAGGAGGEHRHLFRHRERLGLGQDAGRGGEILGAEVEGAQARVRAGSFSEAATLSSRSRMIASAPRLAAPSTKRLAVTGTNSSERHTGSSE